MARRTRRRTLHHHDSDDLDRDGRPKRRGGGPRIGRRVIDDDKKDGNGRKFGRRRETMILFECPGMIGPLDTATLARRQIIPFLGGIGMILGFWSKFFCLCTGRRDDYLIISLTQCFVKVYFSYTYSNRDTIKADGANMMKIWDK